MKTRKSQIPPGTLAGNFLPADYSDCYVCEVNTGRKIAPDDVMVLFWRDMPPWAGALLRLRNFLVQFVGLRGAEGIDQEALEAVVRQGGAHGITSVPAKNENETVMLLTDKHLDAWLSILVESAERGVRVYAITVVKFKQRLGRIYFFVIRPFHVVIVKNMLERALGRYEKE